MPPPLRGSEFCGIVVNQMAAASWEQLDEVVAIPNPNCDDRRVCDDSKLMQLLCTSRFDDSAT
jgi:hypothetical protein